MDRFLTVLMLKPWTGWFLMFRPLMTELLRFLALNSLAGISMVRLAGYEQDNLLGLLDAAVSALAVPPASTIAVDQVAAGALDGDALARDGDEGTLPRLVAKGGLALEDELSMVSEAVVYVMTGRQLTLVPFFRLVRSRVLPAGTEMLSRVILSHLDLPLMASSKVLKVQLTARDWRDTARTGSAVGRAVAVEARAPRRTTKLGSILRDVGL
jgi:hypothetical protein